MDIKLSKIELIICIIIETFSLFAVFKTKYTFPKNVELFYLIKGTVLSINKVVYPTPTLLWKPMSDQRWINESLAIYYFNGGYQTTKVACAILLNNNYEKIIRFNTF